MAATDFPYKGTWAELQEVRSEIARAQARAAEANREMDVLQSHQRQILAIIRTNGGKDPA